MKKHIILSVFLILSICTSAQQLNRVYVLSEGGFSVGTSKISMLDVQTNIFTQSIFNPGNIGLYPDGLIMYNDNMYLVEQGNYGGAGKVYKLDSVGTELQSVEVGTNPFSLAISNNKVYVSNGPTSNVSVLNTTDLSFIKDITVGVYPQEILSFEGNVYVANKSLYNGDLDSTVSVIDASTDEVIYTIKGRQDPNSYTSISFAISNDDHLLFACPGSGTKAIIYKVDINTFAKVDSFTIPNYGFDKDIFVDKNSDKIFFKCNTNEIVGLDLVTRETMVAVSDANILSAYGYGYDYISGNHYLADAKDFGANGSLTVYNSEGTLLNTYETGIAPRRVLFDYGENITDVKGITIANDFQLNQNYPNPFNPTTIISYQLPETGNVKLTIYDALGRKIKVLVNEVQNAGSYNTNFDGSHLVSGIYFYTMRVNKFSSTKKMLLTK